MWSVGLREREPRRGFNYQGIKVWLTGFDHSEDAGVRLMPGLETNQS